MPTLVYARSRDVPSETHITPISICTHNEHKKVYSTLTQPLIYSVAIPPPSLNPSMPSYNIHPSSIASHSKAKHLERVILRRNLLLEEAAQGSPHHDVVADLGDLGEEEQREETSDAAEAGGHGAAVAGVSIVVVLEDWIGLDCPEVKGDVLLDEVAGGEAVEVALDGVPGKKVLVSCSLGGLRGGDDARAAGVM